MAGTVSDPGDSLGAFSVTVDDKKFTLSLDINALCELEEIYSTPEKQVTFADVFEQLGKSGSARHIRKIIWVALRQNHPDMTEHEAGLLLTRMGGLGSIQKLTEALSLRITPDARDAKELGRPRKAQAVKASKANGTGDSATSMPAPSV